MGHNMGRIRGLSLAWAKNQPAKHAGGAVSGVDWLGGRMARKQCDESSQGLIELLKRNGIKPTGDSKKDIELAKHIMRKPYR